MQDAIGNHDVYLHIRVIIGVVLGLGLTRILSGVARIVQHPGKRILYPVHPIWVAAILTMIVHFWWWEFALIRIGPWRFEMFVFVLGYAFLFYLLASLLFPEEMEDYAGYEDYFVSRRGWFFGPLAASFVADFFDTLMKGRERLAGLGVEQAGGLHPALRPRGLDPRPALPFGLRGGLSRLLCELDIADVRRAGVMRTQRLAVAAIVKPPFGSVRPLPPGADAMWRPTVPARSAMPARQPL